MHKISYKLQKVSSIFIAICLLTMLTMIVIQILFRNIFHISCVWTDEIARYAFIWMTMVGASLQVRRKGHFLISLFIDSVKQKKIFNIFINIVVLVVAVELFFWGLKFVAVGFGTPSIAAHINLAWVYSAMPVGAFLMLFYLNEMILEDIGIIPAIEENIESSEITA